MTAPTKRDAIEAAMNLADDVASGKVDPAHLEQQMVEELHELVGTVVGAGDPLWPLQTEVARGVLAVGGIEANELSEWLAVARRRENPDAPSEPLSAPVPIDGSSTVPEPVSSGSVAHSPENDAADDDFADVPRHIIVEAERAAMVVIDQWRESR
ncbi:flagellar hook-length control protein [Mycobacteroides chelonae]|uniref:flagellar hook-length control protein n=1 Tax=Mycobacteroides chelonae TaxID=1774 RepID=UPI0018E38DED|nr:flagellar hook-length control protein [Mycobacteroides chelonae]